jgi:hypothetical protein
MRRLGLSGGVVKQRCAQRNAASGRASGQNDTGCAGFRHCFVFVSIDLTAYEMRLVILPACWVRLNLVNRSDAPSKLFRIYTALYLYASLYA